MLTVFKFIIDVRISQKLSIIIHLYMKEWFNTKLFDSGTRRYFYFDRVTKILSELPNSVVVAFSINKFMD